MKWLLWGQIALVLASIVIAVIGMMTIRYGGMVGLPITSLLVPVVLVVGTVMGLVALKRGEGHVRAGIVLLVPAALLVATKGSDEVSDAFPGPSEKVAEPVYMSMKMWESIEEATRWLNWMWWPLMAAAVLAVPSALLLFKRRES